LDYFWLATMQAGGELAAALEDPAACRHFTDALLPYGDQLGVTASGSLCFGLVATTLGQLALALGDHDAAIGHLRVAVARATAMDAPSESVKARRFLATALVAAGGGRDEVASILDLATSTARRHGFRSELEQLADIAGAPTG
jgi:hypothetical protein